MYDCRVLRSLYALAILVIGCARSGGEELPRLGPVQSEAWSDTVVAGSPTVTCDGNGGYMETVRSLGRPAGAAKDEITYSG